MRPTIVMVLGKRPERSEGISEKLFVSKMFHASVRTVLREEIGIRRRPLGSDRNHARRRTPSCSPPTTSHSIIEVN